MDHVAIVNTPYLDAILSGQKTVEARLLRTRRVPYGRVRAWDRIFFKPPGEPIAAVAFARWVRQFENLTPNGVEALALQYEHVVRGGASFWYEKRSARYGVFIRLESVEAIAPGDDVPVVRGNTRDGWICLDDATTIAA